MTWANFTVEEFACSCCGRNEMSPRAIDRLQELRTRCGFPLRITSGYRCPNHPREKRKAKSGTHGLGLAADVGVSHMRAYTLLTHAMEMGFQGVGVSQKGDELSRFIHLDDAPREPGRPRPHVWSY